MFKIVIAGLIATIVTACTSKHIDSPFIDSPFVETTAVCDNSGIETQYFSFKDRSQKSRDRLGIGGSGRGQTTDVEQETRNLARQLNSYDAEIDAQFRTVTSACKSYSRCMEINRYKEAKCRSSLARWDSSEREFADLSRDLREIEAEIENLRTVTRGRRDVRRRVNKCEDGLCY